MKCPECGAADGLRLHQILEDFDFYKCSVCGVILAKEDLEEIALKNSRSFRD